MKRLFGIRAGILLAAAFTIPKLMNCQGQSVLPPRVC